MLKSIQSKHKNIAYLLLSLTAIYMVLQGFESQDDNFISVTGKVLYDERTYSDSKASVRITEDGKTYETFFADSKGRFNTKLKLNHKYVFNFSMDYHATSKVLVETYVPAEISQGSVSGLFNFNCEIFERVEGMNYALLDKPLLKFKYYKEKNEFSHDKKYDEKILFDLESFKDRLREMKQRRKEVIKEKPVEKEPVVVKKEVKRKPIVFEEKKKPKAVNKRGHRNIMDQFNEPEEEEVSVAVVEDTVEEEEVAEVVKEEKINIEEEEIDPNALFLKEEVDESEYATINVIPKRINIKEEVKKKAPVEHVEKQVVYAKMKRQQSVQLKRIAEEAKIREQVTSFTLRNFRMKEKRLENKKIQNQRLRRLIKSVALAEIYYKKEYYKQNPINHNMVEPILSTSLNESMLKDIELTTVKYPGVRTTFKKETFPFGITYYFINGEETDADTFCSSISSLAKDQYSCSN